MPELAQGPFQPGIPTSLAALPERGLNDSDHAAAIQPRTVPISGYQPPWLAPYAHHVSGGAPADLPTLQPLEIALGPELRLSRCLWPPQGAVPTSPPPAKLQVDTSLFFLPVSLP